MRVYEGTIISCAESDGEGWRVPPGRRPRALSRRGQREDSLRGRRAPRRVPLAAALRARTRALLPAFADAHLHFSSFALFASTLTIDLRDARSIPDVLDRLRARGRGKKPLLGFGLSAHSVAEGRLLEKADLDAALPGVAAYLIKYDGHAAVASSTLLRNCQRGSAPCGATTARRASCSRKPTSPPPTT